MDYSHGALDESPVLKAVSTPSPPLHICPHIKPAINASMQLSHNSPSFYDRIVKLEDLASNDITRMFSPRSAAPVPLYDKTLLPVDSARFRALGVELRGLQQFAGPPPSSVPPFDMKDYITSSNAFNFLTSPDAAWIASPIGSNVPTSMSALGLQHVRKQAGHVNTKPYLAAMFGTSSSKGNMVHQALEPNQSPPSSQSPGPPANNASIIGFSTSERLLMSCRNAPSNHHLSPETPATYATESPKLPNSPSKQESVLSTEDVDIDWQKTQIQTSKRRKTQQKRIVCVPVGDAKQQKSETPPSDMWAWRKYGQKPIKGSPYPRGYYRCSSSKGCSARKQVERSCTDPNMIIVTYTSDHNHAWPASKTNCMNVQVGTHSSLPHHSKDKCEEAQSQSEEAATTSSSEVVNESLFSSIVNSANSVNEQAVSSLEVSLLHEEKRFSFKRDVDLCFLSRTTNAEEDGVFDDLEELPELSSIFCRDYNADDRWLL